MHLQLHYLRYLLTSSVARIRLNLRYYSLRVQKIPEILKIQRGNLLLRVMVSLDGGEPEWLGEDGKSVIMRAWCYDKGILHRVSVNPQSSIV